eukprot:2070366-Amphidinium_carterae.1
MLQRFDHIPVAVTQVVSKVGSGSNQDHVVNVLSYLHLPTRTLQGADQEGMKQINGQPTTRGKPTGTLDRFTHRCLDKDAPATTVHVQRTAESIERKPSLYGQLL